MRESIRRRHAMKHTVDESPRWTREREHIRPMSFHKPSNKVMLDRLMAAVAEMKMRRVMREAREAGEDNPYRYRSAA